MGKIRCKGENYILLINNIQGLLWVMERLDIITNAEYNGLVVRWGLFFSLEK